MSEQSPNALICPSCRTRLRFEPQQAGKPLPCPECGQSLIVSPDLQHIVWPLPQEPADSPTTPRRGIAIAGAAIVVALVAFTLWPRHQPALLPEERLDPPTMDVGPIAQPEPETTPHVAIVTPEVATKEEVPLVVAQVPEQQKLPLARVAQLLADAPPPEPEPRSAGAVQDPAVIPVNGEQPATAATPTAPPPQELIAAALQQRIVSFTVPSKTPLKSLVRELNELANGFIVISPEVSAVTLNKPTSVTLKDATLRDVLDAIARSAELRVVVADDRIELQPK